MKVGYCVPHTPAMASYRFRVAIPAPLLGCEYEIGTYGNPSFFYKHFEGDIELAKAAGPFVFDVVNDHFGGKHDYHYRWMCEHASAVTCSSAEMAAIIKRWTGRDAVVIDDPYENAEWEPQCLGPEVLWLGHEANIPSLLEQMDNLEKLATLPILLTVCTNFQHPEALPWSPDTERRSLGRCALMLVTGNNKGASANRIVKSLRAGRFVVCPPGTPAWDEWADCIWVGDVKEGIEWAFNNREEACRKIAAGQARLKEKNSPKTIAAQWMEVFASISPPATSGSADGSA